MSDWCCAIIDVRNGNDCKTGKGAAFRTEAEARTGWAKAQRLAMPAAMADFIVDLHDANGDIVETVGISEAGFETLLGFKPASPRTYREYDRAYWARARAAAAMAGVFTTDHK